MPAMDVFVRPEVKALKKIKIGWLLVLMAVCVSGPAHGAEPDTHSIKLGAVLPLTGELSLVGETEKNAGLMAVESINGSGGIRGQSLTLIIEDSAEMPGLGQSAMRKLISDTSVVAVTGGCSSTQAFRAAALAEALKTPFLIATASADRITTQGWSYIFRLTPPAGEYLNPLQSFIQRVGDVKTAAVIFEKGPFGQFGRKRFERFRRRTGIKLVRQERFEEGMHDFGPLFERVKARHPDLVYMIASEPATPAFMLRSAKAVHLSSSLFFGHGQGFISPNFAQYAGRAAEGVFSSTLWVPSVPYSGAMEFAAEYEARFGAPPDYHAAQAFAAIMVMADAIRRADSLTREDVKEALGRTDMMTAFGPVRFVNYVDKTQQNRLPKPVVQWLGGRLETVWPKSCASSPYRYPAP